MWKMSVTAYNLKINLYCATYIFFFIYIEVFLTFYNIAPTEQYFTNR